MKPILRPLVALLACPFLWGGGCIAWEIRDQMRSANSHIARTEWRLEDVTRDIEQTNTQLAQVQTTLAQTETTLAQTHATLGQVSGQLTAVYASLQKTDEHLVAVGSLLETTHPKLTTLDGQLERMKILGDVNTSLKDVDLALKPLSKSMGVLSSAASFFGGGGDNQDLLARESAPSEPAAPEPAPRDEGSAAAAQGATPPVAVSPPAATPAAAPPSAPPSTPPSTPPAAAATGTPPPPAPAGSKATAAEAPRPDLLVGTWLLVYPPPAPPKRYGQAIILTADGAFLDAEPDKPLRRGHWTRTGRSVTMRPEGGDEATAELLTLTSRTLTLRRGDQIEVYSRP